MATVQTPKRGPKPSRDGIQAKVDFVEHQLAGKGLNRLQAVQRLMKKFPSTSEKYARAIIFSRCVGMDFVPIRQATAKQIVPPKASVKAPKKVAKPTVPKSASKPAVQRHPTVKRKKTEHLKADDDGFVTDFGV